MLQETLPTQYSVASMNCTFLGILAQYGTCGFCGIVKTTFLTNRKELSILKRHILRIKVGKQLTPRFQTFFFYPEIPDHSFLLINHIKSSKSNF